MIVPLFGTVVMSTESLVTVLVRVIFLPSFVIIGHSSSRERHKDENDDVFVLRAETL